MDGRTDKIAIIFPFPLKTLNFIIFEINLNNIRAYPKILNNYVAHRNIQHLPKRLKNALIKNVNSKTKFGIIINFPSRNTFLRRVEKKMKN